MIVMTLIFAGWKLLKSKRNTKVSVRQCLLSIHSLITAMSNSGVICCEDLERAIVAFELQVSHKFC